MKKLALLLTAVALVMCTPIIKAQTIVGSAHDFSTQTWNTSGEICKVCHTPHNGSMLPEAPLWNHQLTTATFTLYTSSTMNAVVGQPDGNSKLCLSCHDGTVALENFGGVTNGTHKMLPGDPGYVGTDLSNDHPVSFTYNTALATADGQLFDPSVHLSGITPSGTIATDMLFAGKVQCASCHDVHNSVAGTASLLLKSNAASALCLTCHDK